MQIKTLTTVAGVNEIDFGNDDSQTTAHFYWFKNLSNSTLYVSAVPDPVAGEDNVAELSAKGAASVETDEGKVYVLGAGKVEIHRTNSKFCPFELPSSGSGGSGGGSITVDSELSETSENPLQNKATTAAINEVKSDLAKTQEDVAENAAALNTKSDINHIHDITASGNPVTLDGLQGSVPFSGMAVSGKNLLNYRISALPPGITVTTLGDGSLKVSGKMERESAWGINLIAKNPLPKGKTYTLSVNPDVIGILPINIYYIGAATENNTFVWDRDDDFTISLNIQPNVDYDFVFRPQLELGDTATYYEPPITSQEVTITRCGKNLLKPKSSPFSHNGVTAVVNDDGSVTINRTEASEANSYIQLWNNMSARSIGTKKITINAVDSQSLGSCYMGIDRLENGTYLDRVVVGIINNGVGTVTQEDIDNDRLFRTWIFIHKDYSPNNLTIYPQLELGDTATEYEPYHADTISITPASNPYTIQNGLLQYNDINTLIASIGELKVVGVQKNAAVKKVWDEITEVEHNADSMQSEITALGNVNAEGTLVVLDDLQGDVPFSEMVVSGKNLLKYPYHTTTQTINGVTFTDNGDGTITANGTATAISSYALIWKNFYLPKGTYTISGSPEGGDVNTGFYAVCGTDTARFATDTGNGGTFSIIDDINDFTFSLCINSGVTVDNVVFRPQLELGPIPTAYELPITGRELTLAVSGKNLINNIQATGTVVGVTVTKNDDGTVTINGTTTGDLWLLFDDKCRVVKDKTYTFSMGFDTSVGIMFGVRSGDNAQSYLSTGTSGSFVAPETGICRIRGYVKSGITFDNLTIYPQLEIGSTATPYEPYNGTEYNITPDNNPYIIPNDIRQLDGLNNISVSAGELSVVGVQRNATIKKIWDKFTSIDNDIVDLYSKISTLEFNTSASIEANGQEIVAVRHALNSISDDVSSVTDNVAINTSDIKTLKNDNEALRVEIDELRALIETT